MLLNKQPYEAIFLVGTFLLRVCIETFQDFMISPNKNHQKFNDSTPQSTSMPMPYYPFFHNHGSVGMTGIESKLIFETSHFRLNYGRKSIPENFQQGSSYLQPIEMKYVSSIPAYHHISESEGLTKTPKEDGTPINIFIYWYNFGNENPLQK